MTVEASSPALIEKVRSVVSDGTGRYRIEELRPGTYALAFTLPGFATVRREGIELTGTFVATVNADLRVGALEETVTVTGETPIVDVQSTARQRVLDQVDLRFSKILRYGRNRVTAGLDVYNALNSSSILSINNAFATWQQPQQILPARLRRSSCSSIFRWMPGPRGPGLRQLPVGRVRLDPPKLEA